MTNPNTALGNNIKLNSLSIINYYGFLKSYEPLYIEYTFDSFENSQSIKKLKMSKLSDFYHVLIPLDNISSGKIYFQFITEDGKLDNNNNNYFYKDINEIESPLNCNTELSLIPLKSKKLQCNKLRFSYKLNKRIKILLIKLYRKLPNFITGNYRRRINL